MDGMPPPGSPKVSAVEMPQTALERAETYAKAADHLFAEHRRSNSPLDLPARFCALQAIELYLYAFLRFRGVASGHIKARHHGLWHEEFCHRLELDTKTCRHLRDLTDAKAHVAVRYPNEHQGPLCPINRMERTLEAIREKADRIPFQS